jgi:hypothetical protein
VNRQHVWRLGLLAALLALVVAVLPDGEAPGRPLTVADLQQAARMAFSGSRGVVFHPLVHPRAAGDMVIDASVAAGPVGQAMPSGFVGLSIEYHALREYVGRDPRALNPVFVALMRGLAPGQSPILRIGGNSTDQTWWPVPHGVEPGGVSYSLTNGWLQVAHALAAGANTRLILGINLAADSPVLAGVEARALVQGIGRRYIDALEIGNEPDAYTQFAWYRAADGHVYFSRPRDYSFQSFLSDFSRWRTMMPKLPIAGPAFSEATWMPNLPAFINHEPGIRMVTFHRYPLRGCEPNPAMPDYASIPNLMKDTASAGLARSVAPFATAAHNAGIPFRLDELNSASCTGKLGVSNTFASALWALDTLFNMASVGVDGVNFHTLPGAPYAPFGFTHSGSRWSASVRPMYYGLLMFGQAFPVGARLLTVDAPTGPVKIWATQSTDGRIRVAVINKDPSSAAVVRLQLPGAATPLAAESLSAASLAATGGVTLGGRSFGAATTTGVLGPPHTTRVSPVLGQYMVTVPAASATLLTR